MMVVKNPVEIKVSSILEQLSFAGHATSYETAHKALSLSGLTKATGCSHRPLHSPETNISWRQ